MTNEDVMSTDKDGTQAEAWEFVRHANGILGTSDSAGTTPERQDAVELGWMDADVLPASEAASLSPKARRSQELYDSFRHLVIEEQWSIEGWIRNKNVAIDELDGTLGLVNVAMQFFRSVGLHRFGVFAAEEPSHD